MTSPYRSVPTLSTLRTFEAVARKGGCTRAHGAAVADVDHA